MAVIYAYKNCGKKAININRFISLGGISPKTFLRDYWQKKPLLIRRAIPDFQGLLTRDELIKLAGQEEAQSRLISKKNDHWIVKQGPLVSQDFSGKKNSWTLLVHDVNHFYPCARDLLLKFRFIPYARLDDLMISYASKGGGIGPHIDSYDVFLLQGQGAKRWQISSQQDTRLIEDVPLKILREFVPEQEWVLKSGDILYLPPNYAHHGMAENDCMTYSIGFRAPSHQELMVQFLVYMQDRIKADGWYKDPDMQLQTNPASISSAMFQQTKTIINKIKWRNFDIENFLGIYLTEPKSTVFFNRPSNPLNRENFVQQAKKFGVQLDLKGRMLVRKKNFFINGEMYEMQTGRARLALKGFAGDLKILPCTALDDETSELLYQWYLYGYITLINGVNC